jgi:site-specific DNA-methyltransferase (cytosine-N4-specific)
MATPYYEDDSVTLFHGDALAVASELPDAGASCIVTSPPYYGLRDYGVSGQYGLESSPAEYVETLRALFHELRRVLADDGTMWLNLGDGYSTRKVIRDSSHQSGFHPTRTDHHSLGKSWVENKADGNTRMPAGYGLPEKNLLGAPWRVAFALQDDGWILRNSIVWHKPNAMPESVSDRLAVRHEMVFLFVKAKRYWFNLDALRRPHAQVTLDSVGRARISYEAPGQAPNMKSRRLSAAGANPGDVWEIPTRPFASAHFAVMPLELAERCVQAGCKPDGVVLDPFSGSATTGLAAARHGRKYIGIELNADYIDLSLRTRLHQPGLDFGEE